MTAWDVSVDPAFGNAAARGPVLNAAFEFSNGVAFNLFNGPNVGDLTSQITNRGAPESLNYFLSDLGIDDPFHIRRFVDLVINRTGDGRFTLRLEDELRGTPG